MRNTAVRIVTVVGIAAVAALGTQYASAAPGHDVRHAVAPLRNIAYQYGTSTTGGSGDVEYNIPNPPNGLYYASFSANFFPAGTPSAPETFGCSLIKNGSIMRAQDTTMTASSSGFYAGVNGGNVIKIDGVSQFQMFCGTADGSAWTWGTLPVQVNLIRIDGLQAGGQLGGGAPKQRGQLSIDATR